MSSKVLQQVARSGQVFQRRGFVEIPSVLREYDMFRGMEDDPDFQKKTRISGHSHEVFLVNGIYFHGHMLAFPEHSFLWKPSEVSTENSVLKASHLPTLFGMEAFRIFELVHPRPSNI